MTNPYFQRLIRALSSLCIAGLLVSAVHADDGNAVADKTTNQQNQVQEATANITYDNLDQLQMTNVSLVPVSLNFPVVTPPFPAALPPPTPAFPLRVAREFLVVERLDTGFRYRYVDNGPHKVTDRDPFYGVDTLLRINLVREGKTYVEMRAETGSSVTSSFDYMGLGLHPTADSFNVKSFVLGQKFGSHVEAQAGGLLFQYGAGTEATYADYDSYLEGYRVQWGGFGRRWLPDTVLATAGYVGDFTVLNTFARMYRMEELNYAQILAQKKFRPNLDTSGEYDTIQGISYFRAAYHQKNIPGVFFDELQLEALTRTSNNSTFGWYGNISRKVDSKERLRLGFFSSDVPVRMFLNGKTQVLMNGDTIVLGKHVGPVIRMFPTKSIEVVCLGSALVDGAAAPRYRGQVVIRYHLADAMNRLMRR